MPKATVKKGTAVYRAVINVIAKAAPFMRHWEGLDDLTATVRFATAQASYASTEGEFPWDRLTVKEEVFSIDGISIATAELVHAALRVAKATNTLREAEGKKWIDFYSLAVDMEMAEQNGKKLDVGESLYA